MWIRKPTKEAFEVDLSIAGGGFFIIIFGGIVSVGGLHAKTSNNSNPSPLLGTIIVIGGLAIVVFGLILAIANVIVWTARRRTHKRSQTRERSRYRP
jgi:TRAP-type C4-dicarboxylate transport system permease small subunit